MGWSPAERPVHCVRGAWPPAVAAPCSRRRAQGSETRRAPRAERPDHCRPDAWLRQAAPDSYRRVQGPVRMRARRAPRLRTGALAQPAPRPSRARAAALVPTDGLDFLPLRRGTQQIRHARRGRPVRGRCSAAWPVRSAPAARSVRGGSHVRTDSGGAAGSARKRSGRAALECSADSAQTEPAAAVRLPDDPCRPHRCRCRCRARSPSDKALPRRCRASRLPSLRLPRRAVFSVVNNLARTPGLG